MKRNQELESSRAVLRREVEILRASVRQHKDKLQHVQELLTSREEAHRCVYNTARVYDTSVSIPSGRHVARHTVVLRAGRS